MKAPHIRCHLLFHTGLALLVFLTSCRPSVAETIPMPVNTTLPIITSTTTPQASATPRRIPTSTKIQEITTLESVPISNNHICSPLSGYSLTELESAIHNPFRPPRPGRDDPHQGVDLAVVRDGMAIPGEPILSVMPGTIAGLIQDRFPYGFALMIETPIDSFDGDFLSNFQLPSSFPTREPHPALTCPPFDPVPAWDMHKRSLYLLYAHMRTMGNFQLEDTVACGTQLGEVGQSGNALNPHLHLEVRLGPAGARFKSMAHYLSDATQEEMNNYCSWRVRDIFLLIDPLVILSALP